MLKKPHYYAQKIFPGSLIYYVKYTTIALYDYIEDYFDNI